MRAVAWLLPVVVVMAALAPARASAQAPPRAGAMSTPQERAQALHDEAAGLYERGEYREAIGKLEVALSLDPTGKELVYNLALIHERLAEIEQAESYYRRFLDMETDPKAREKVAATVKRLEGAKKHVVHVAAGPLVLPPPEAPRVLIPPPPPRKMNPWLIVFGGAAAVGVVVGTSFGIAAIANNPGETGTTGAGVSVDDLRANAKMAHRDAVVADLAFAGAVVTAGAAIYVFLASRSPYAPLPGDPPAAGAIPPRAHHAQRSAVGFTF